MKFRLLVVDDDPSLLQALRLQLTSSGYTVDTAADGAEALELVRQNPNGYALIILDYGMKMAGPSTVRAVREISPDQFIVMYSGNDSRDALQLTWQAGAVGFLEKGRPIEELLDVVANWCRKYEETNGVVAPLPADGNSRLGSMNLVGRSASLEQIAQKVERYRRVRQNILILGETGTGKELIARALHGKSEKPFLAVNCAAYRGSTDLLESELFGYERGAFTGATTDKKGIFEAAEGGVVFLDELHHLSATAQAKLLRTIQERRVRRVGGTKEVEVDFRLIGAAKPDILERCDRGEFLTDLYHRISVLNLTIPPLRERVEDIEPLVSFFCRKFERETGEAKHFLLRTIKYFEAYHWPGNVRELENAVYQILTDVPAAKISPEHLDAKFFRKREESAPHSYDELKRRLEQQEKEYISHVIRKARTKSDAARKLKISPTTLHSVLQRLGI